MYWTIIVILFLFVSFRPETMADYENYANGYNKLTERFEPFYQLILNFLHYYNFGSFSFFVVMALLTVSIKGDVVWRMSQLPLLSLLVWLSDILIIQDMIAIRAALASSLLLWIIYWKVNNKIKYVWLTLVLAVCCHYSALVLLIFPCLSSSKPYRKLYLVALVSSMLLPFSNFSAFSLIPNFSNAYNTLIDMYAQQNSANPYNLVVLARCLICVLLWVNIGNVSVQDKYYLLCTKAYTIGCILFYLFWQQISIAFRFGELFWVTEIISLPYLLYFFTFRHKSIGKLIPIVISIVLFCINITSTMYWDIT